MRTNNDLRVILKNVIAAGSALSLYSIYLHFTEPGLHRIAGFFSAAGGEGLDRQASFNEIGALYALAAVLALNYLFWCNKSSQRWESIMIAIGFLLNTLGLVLVQSRSAFLAFGIGSSALLLPRLNLRRFLITGRIGKKAIIFGTAISAAVVLILIGSVRLVSVDRILGTFVPGSSAYASAIERFVLWNKAMSVWLDEASHFLLGYGFGSTANLIGANSAHNFLLNIGLRLGLAGLVPVVILLIWPTMGVTRRTGGQVAVGAAIAAVSVALTVSMFGNTLVDPFYGGCTFIILYGCLGVCPSLREHLQ